MKRQRPNKGSKKPSLRLVTQDDLELKRRLAMELTEDEDDGGDGGDDGSLLRPDSREVLTDLNKQEELLTEQSQGHGKIAAVIPHVPKSDINDMNNDIGDAYQNSTHPLLGDSQRWDGVGLEDRIMSPLDNPLAYAELQQELQKQYQKRLERQNQLSSSIANTMTLKR